MNVHHCQGFTLIELLVSSALGLLLISGLAQISLFQRDLYQLQRATEEVQENSLFAQQFLAEGIRHAGFNIDNDAPITDNSTDNHGNAKTSDQIEVQFTSDGAMTDCQSSYAIPIGARVRNRVYVANKNLMCWSSVSNSAQSLVEGILQLQVQYGEDTDGDQSLNRYVTFDEIIEIKHVNSARIALLVSSISGHTDQQKQSSLTLLEINIAASALPSKQRLELTTFTIPFARI